MLIRSLLSSRYNDTFNSRNGAENKKKPKRNHCGKCISSKQFWWKSKKTEEEQATEEKIIV